MSSEILQDIVCCIGQSLEANPLQFMMERAFEEADLDWRYLMLEVAPENLGDAVRGIRAFGFAGATVSTPHKESVLAHLTRLTETARLMGAVNILYREDGDLVGDNANGRALLKALRNVADPAGKVALVLGAGGMGRALAVELARAGVAKVILANRTPERAEALAAVIREELGVQTEVRQLTKKLDVPEPVDLLVNATAAGFGEDNARAPIDVKTLRSGMIVADVMFHPLETRLLEAARAAGCFTITGLDMLVYQTYESFERWTGVQTSVETLREAADEFLTV